MYKKTKLKNGITILLEPMKETRSISMCIFVKNGSVYENNENNGISHFIEHMLFKGTYKRNAHDLAEEMDSIGASFNAYTSSEHTCYYFKVLDTYFDLAAEILSDMYLNPKFDEKDIAKEKGVVIEEINMSEDTPDDIVFEKLQCEIMKNTPYGRTVLGSRKNVVGFNHDIISNYYNDHYRTDNTIISVAGNFACDDMYNKLEMLFGDKKPSDIEDKFTFSVSQKQSAVKTEKDIEQLHICISFPGISLLDERNYVMTAMNTILGGGMSSILFQKIREENGLAYSIYSFPSSYGLSGLFSIYTALNYEQLKPAITLIINELKNFKKNKINEKILNKVKVQLKCNHLLALENSSNRASFLGRYETVFGRIPTTEEIEKKIDAITENNVKNLADEIFNFDKMSISIVGKVKNINPDNYINI